jgi:hypothetical protein
MMYFLFFAGGCVLGLLGACILLHRRVVLTELQCAREIDVALAAEWLAQYNYGYMVAMQYVMMREVGANYQKLQRLAREHLDRVAQYGTLGQLIPTELVPDNLRDAAKAYNRRVTLLWPLPYSKMLPKEDEATTRVRQLQDAIAILRMQDERTLEETEVNWLARQAGTSYAAAESVLTVFLKNAHSRVDHILGVPDVEEVLPSIY